MFVQRRSALAVSEKMPGGSNEGEGQTKAKEVCPFLGVARHSRPLPLGGRGRGRLHLGGRGQLHLGGRGRLHLTPLGIYIYTYTLYSPQP